MLLYQSKILGLPIASLQASHRVGIITGLIIQPTNLQIVALEVDSSISQDMLYLHTEDIVEMKPRGVLINHNQQLMEADDLVRLNKLIEQDFALVEK